MNDLSKLQRQSSLARFSSAQGTPSRSPPLSSEQPLQPQSDIYFDWDRVVTEPLIPNCFVIDQSVKHRVRFQRREIAVFCTF